jgi:hypothetical protein
MTTVLELNNNKHFQNVLYSYEGGSGGRLEKIA